MPLNIQNGLYKLFFSYRWDSKNKASCSFTKKLNRHETYNNNKRIREEVNLIGYKFPRRFFYVLTAIYYPVLEKKNKEIFKAETMDVLYDSLLSLIELYDKEEHKTSDSIFIINDNGVPNAFFPSVWKNGQKSGMEAFRET